MKSKIKTTMNAVFNSVKIPACFVLALFIMASTSWAADYYVDRTAGNDSNNGSMTHPWAYCPGMGGWTGSNDPLRAGDIVYFDSSDTWTASSGIYMLEVRAGVSYIGNSSYGGGSKAKFQATGYIRDAIIWFGEDHNDSETIVQGFEVDVNKQRTTGIGVNWPNSQKDLVGEAKKKIQDCVVHDVYSVWPAAEYGIKVGTPNSGGKTYNVEISNCEVYNISRSGICIYPAVDSSLNQIKNIVVSECKVSNTGQDPEASGDGIMFKNNILDGIIEYNFVRSTSGRGIAIYNTPGITGPQNAKVRYNIITSCNKGGVLIAQPGNKSLDIYGNLIFKNTGNGIIFQIDLSGDIKAKIYNNTLYQNSDNEIYLGTSSANFTTMEIKNNLIYSHSGKYPLYSPVAGRITSHSNNLYFRPESSDLVRDGSKYYSSANIDTWESTALVVDPLFVNTENIPSGFTGTKGIDLKPNSDGFDIKTDSPAKSFGVTIQEYNESINSIVRENSGDWELGAYEHVDSEEQPLPKIPINGATKS